MDSSRDRPSRNQQPGPARGSGVGMTVGTSCAGPTGSDTHPPIGFLLGVERFLANDPMPHLSWESLLTLFQQKCLDDLLRGYRLGALFPAVGGML